MMQRLFRQEPAPPWSYLGALGAILAAFLALIIGATVADTVLGDDPVALLVGWSIGMALTVVFVMASRGRRAQDLAALRIGPTHARLLVIALIAVGLVVLLDLLSWVVVGDQTLAAAELLRFDADTSAVSWLIALAFMALLQPAAEELLFRGMAFPALRTTLGVGIGFYATAGLHAVFHLAAYPPPGDNGTVALWYGLLLPFLDGLVFTGVRAATGSTRAAMVSHAVFGTFAVLKVAALAG